MSQYCLSWSVVDVFPLLVSAGGVVELFWLLLGAVVFDVGGREVIVLVELGPAALYSSVHLIYSLSLRL